MNEYLGHIGLGCLTLLPIPVAFVVVVIGGLAGGGMVLLVLGSGIMCCGGLFAFIAIDQGTGTHTAVLVSGHQWERKIAVEEYVSYTDDDWCDDMPVDADVYRRESKFHHRNKRIDRDIDVYEDYCYYEACKWKVVDHEVKSGDRTEPPPLLAEGS